jgi:diadenosine tetraphosphate (Ap4A) HIT family hydrolase
MFLACPVRLFRDRRDAGRRLARALGYLRGLDVVVVGLPRGGVPVADEVARALEVPLDIVLVRKLGAPFQREYAIGTIGEDGALFVNERALALLGLSQDELMRIALRERVELERLSGLYRGEHEPLPVEGRTVILVDDGSGQVTPRSAIEHKGCAFCAIVSGEDRSVEIVCEDESWLAFFPLDPATPGHTLIIPRTHTSDLWESPTAVAIELMRGIVRVGRAINSALKPEGMNLITSAGKAAEQTVFHLHLHLVPRWTGDGFGHIWPVDDRKYQDVRIQDAADRIRAACRVEREA